MAYMEGIAVAKSLAAKSRQHVNANAELVAVGAANVAGGFFQAFPVAGGFSRSAVNFSAGARTPIATVVTAAVVALTAVAFTPAFYHLPKAVLAAIVVVAVLGLVDVKGGPDGLAHPPLRRRGGRADVPGDAPDGSGARVWPPAWRSASPCSSGARPARTRPNSAACPAPTPTATWSATRAWPPIPRAAVVRVDGPLYFANAQLLEDRLLALAEERGELRAWCWTRARSATWTPMAPTCSANCASGWPIET